VRIGIDAGVAGIVTIARDVPGEIGVISGTNAATIRAKGRNGKHRPRMGSNSVGMEVWLSSLAYLSWWLTVLARQPRLMMVEVDLVVL
jgi:hypothetical protein